MLVCNQYSKVPGQVQPILITRMKKLIAICCGCKLRFSLHIIHIALVA
ncbi:hypothetical protein [Escherichia phage ZCEC12]|nr:hypothetical protein P9622_gp03 [Escherichia phage ZCEC10]UJQ87884.1 hypothetical protein [Escherichia phage ZCEC11]UJQ87910.1 hypothetical protein [Escherichia phage ZCEC12]UJQ88055.1 hypothetical protein [Escherichia phage ZCEC10]